MEKLILYQFVSCPYCAKVRAVLDQKNIPYEAVEVSFDTNDDVRKKIKAESGISTVPVIQIGEMYLGESADIIEYLDEHY